MLNWLFRNQIEKTVQERVNQMAVTMAKEMTDMYKKEIDQIRANLPEDVVKAVDMDNLAEKVLLNFRPQDIAAQMCYQQLAEEFDPADIAGAMDLSDFASNLDMSDIAAELSLSDLANELDTSEIADLVSREIDAAEVAESLARRIPVSDIADAFDMEDIVNRLQAAMPALDYRKLAIALLEQIKETP